MFVRNKGLLYLNLTNSLATALLQLLLVAYDGQTPFAILLYRRASSITPFLSVLRAFRLPYLRLLKLASMLVSIKRLHDY